jgi:proline iminopeptidase
MPRPTSTGGEFPYVVEGSGIPCVVVNRSNFGALYSKELREHFKLVFLDFGNSHESNQPAGFNEVTLDTLLDEIEQARRSLGVDRIAVLGHSTPGIFALEYARKYPEHTSHVILIGTPPALNQQWLKAQEEFWNSDASQERKEELQSNLEKITDDDLKSVSPDRAWALQNIRTVPRYWYDPKYDSSWIWEGIDFNVGFMYHVFNVVLKDYDVAQSPERITAPVFLALGRYDYVVPYTLWNDKTEKLPDLSIKLFERSGHYAMFEEQALFDASLIEWAKREDR